MTTTTVTLRRPPRALLAALCLTATMLAPVASAQDDPVVVPTRPWADARTGVYRGITVTSDLDPGLVRAIADRVIEVHEEAGTLLGDLPTRGPIELELLLFASEADRDEVLRLERGVRPGRDPVTVFATDTGTALAAVVPATPGQPFFEALRAGGFRHWAEGRFDGDLPAWVDEGVSTWMGFAIAIGDRTIPGLCDRRVLERLQTAILEDAWIPFAEFLELAPGEPAVRRDVEDDVRRAQAWSMVDWMLRDVTRREAFLRYLRLLNSGYREQECRRRAFRDSRYELPEAMEASWLEFVVERVPNPLLDAHDRLVLFAEGQRALRAEGLAASDLDDLRSRLAAAGFTHEIERFGVVRRLDASDPARLQMPPGDPAVRRPVFRSEPSREIERAASRGRYPLDAPRPLDVSTRDLRQASGFGDLRIRWFALEEGDLGYVIEFR